jgi:hypothetical protein
VTGGQQADPREAPANSEDRPAGTATTEPPVDTIDAVRKQLGASEVRVVTYHRQRESPTNIYSRSMTRADVEIGSADPIARLWPRPGLYYLWWPGVQ